MIKAYNLETRELIGEYKTMQEVANAFDLTIACVKAYFYRYKELGKARIKNHNTNAWCYLEKPETKRMPNYKERCLQAIELIEDNRNYYYDRLQENIYKERFSKDINKLLDILGAGNNEYYI